VRFLLSDTRFGQIVENRLGFYFQVARELIDANLICFRHSPVDFSFCSTVWSSGALGSPEDTSAGSGAAFGEVS